MSSDSAPDNKPTVLHTSTLARTRLFHVEQMELRFANGVEVSYERLVSGGHGAVLIVPLLEDDTVDSPVAVDLQIKGLHERLVKLGRWLCE